jgi:sec-independent protein translocase protein TatC
MSMIPVLFIIGVAFGYFVVLPAAVRFLQNFNSDQFNILLQARDYYKFAVLSLAASGLVFQLPVAILALTRLGIVTPQFLTRNWRYAIVLLTVLAVLLPGTDPVSTMIEAVPLYLLYVFSIIMARFVKPPAEDLEETADSLD